MERCKCCSPRCALRVIESIRRLQLADGDKIHFMWVATVLRGCAGVFFTEGGDVLSDYVHQVLINEKGVRKTAPLILYPTPKD
jgi:hypothetical protein